MKACKPQSILTWIRLAGFFFVSLQGKPSIYPPVALLLWNKFHTFAHRKHNLLYKKTVSKNLE